jgi:hypothetical protein
MAKDYTPRQQSAPRVSEEVAMGTMAGPLRPSHDEALTDLGPDAAALVRSALVRANQLRNAPQPIDPGIAFIMGVVLTYRAIEAQYNLDTSLAEIASLPEAATDRPDLNDHRGVDQPAA